MAKKRSLTEFFKGRVTPAIAEKLRIIDQLAGKSIGHSRFYSDLDEVSEKCESWLPVFLLPFGRETFRACLHFRPSDVSSGRLAVMRADDEGEMIEIANSLEQFVYRALLEEEAWGNEEGKMMKSFPDSVASANALFGADFYKQGRHGNFKGDDVEQLIIDHFGGTAHAFYVGAVFLDTPREKLTYYEKGLAIEPACMALYVGAVKALVALNDRRSAAERFARSLDCYHYTAYDADLNEYFELGRSLLKEFPDLFYDDRKWILNETDPHNWARRAGELFNQGEVERADKILNDTCYGIRDYSGSIGAFRKHYEKLGWDWALALCDLRTQ